jgi:hypothetical protein
LIARSVVEAQKRLAPSRIAAARAEEGSLSFNRRFFMRDQIDAAARLLKSPLQK